MTTFSGFSLDARILKAIDSKGYTTPTPVQAQAIPAILEGNDLFVTAPTGTGKTAAFAIPALQHLIDSPGKGVHTLILAPTRELALQIADNYRLYGKGQNLRMALIYGGVSQHHQVRDIQNGARVLIATPGRLMDLMDQGYVNLSHVKILVLDECDRMLDMGFIGDIRKIAHAIHSPQRQTLLFSATASAEIRKLSTEVLNNPQNIDIVPAPEDSPDIDEFLFGVKRDHKYDLLKYILSDEDVDSLLVFTRTKFGADRITKKLVKDGIKSLAIHGDKSQSQREKNMTSFRNGHTRVLVATDVAARGLDVKDLKYILNYDMPSDPDTYVHRIGRTGRAGSRGLAFSFCDETELNLLYQIQKQLGPTRFSVAEHEWSMELPAFRSNSGNRGSSGGGRHRGKPRNKRNSNQSRHTSSEGNFSKGGHTKKKKNKTTQRIK